MGLYTGPKAWNPGAPYGEIVEVSNLWSELLGDSHTEPDLLSPFSGLKNLPITRPGAHAPGYSLTRLWRSVGLLKPPRGGGQKIARGVSPRKARIEIPQPRKGATERWFSATHPFRARAFRPSVWAADPKAPAFDYLPPSQSRWLTSVSRRIDLVSKHGRSCKCPRPGANFLVT